MAVTLEIPRPLDKELTQEAAREGVSLDNHATVLLYLVNALIAEEQPSPFKQAVREYIASNNLDVQHVTRVFESLLALCLYHDTGNETSTFQRVLANEQLGDDIALLRDWRNSVVHSIDFSASTWASLLPLTEPALQSASRVPRTPDILITSEDTEEARIRAIHAARGSMKQARVSVDDLHRERQRDKEKEEKGLHWEVHDHDPRSIKLHVEAPTVEKRRCVTQSRAKVD